MSVDVSVLIVNYNACRLVVECIRSIYRWRLSCSFEVIVVDNNSSDDSVERIRAEFPRVRLEVNRENIGFARANNQAFSVSRGSYCLLLNPDAQVFRGSVDALFGFMESNPAVGVCGPQLLRSDHSVQRSFSRFPSRRRELMESIFLGRATLGSKSVSFLGLRNSGITESRSVEWITGACLMLRRKMCDQIGMFDPRFFLYYEEVDLCYRARRHGWDIVVYPEAKVLHHGGRSTRLRLEMSLIEAYKSRYYFFKKHFPPQAVMQISSLIRMGVRNRLFVWRMLVLCGFRPKEAGVRIRAYRNILNIQREPVVALEVTSIERSRAGVGCYARNLMERLSELSVRENFLFLPMGLEAVGGSPVRSRFLLLRILAGIKRLIWEQVIVPFRIFRGRISVFHGPAFICHLWKTSPAVITIHDVAYLVYPEKFVSAYRYYLKFWIPRCIRAADKVITVSHSSRKDIIRMLDVPAGKVEVIYNGKVDSFRVICDEALLSSCRRRYGLPKRYILYLGTLEPRKNIRGLVKGYARFRALCPDLDHKLVLGGGRGWMYEDIFTLIEEMGLDDEVRIIGYIPQKDLPLIYNGAQLFVYPSFYEGFGLPVVEAMACGVPVITSNTSSLPEIVGDAGLMVEPVDYGAMAEAMRRVLTDGSMRKRMVERGLLRAEKFTWEKTAESTLALYRRIMDKSPKAGRVKHGSCRH
ncbi:MAG: glycosyltransferase [Candidatus Omnitrophica bacterium]|nr:glycosyltransferase [Candidatus Omnitrophota bacterium]